MKTTYKDFCSNTLYTFYLPEENGGIIDNSKIIIAVTTPENETVKTVNVREAADYAFKINKKSLAAENGARGLFEYVQRCIRADLMTCNVVKIATAAIDF